MRLCGACLGGRSSITTVNQPPLIDSSNQLDPAGGGWEDSADATSWARNVSPPHPARAD
ncbi:hypothetical protein CHELA1G2_40034 [Hyphomicrobiales bacterium]|nr:hypothetical protein CHELA1G2_40034 [Hyphomicrobiales bacterium]